MAEITITRTAQDAASKSLRVTVPVERVQAAEHRAVREYAQRARLPGFRKGHAPEAVVRKKFGTAIRQWVLEEVIREGWEQAKTAENLEPIADPAVRNLRFEEGQPVEFDLVVEVRPELQLARLGGFTLTRTVRQVTDEMVTDQMERIREARAAWLPVDGEPPSPGNLVRVDVAAIENGDAKEPKSHTIVLGEGQAHPALEEKIMTLRSGETADAELRYPEDHPDPARRGQARRVRISLWEVKRQELPPVDDAFAKEVGDFEDLAALRAAVRRDLEQEAAREADAAVREQLVQSIVEANQVEAPPSLVERMIHVFLHSYEVPAERHEAFHTEFRPVAVAQVRRELVINAVAQRHGLKSTEAEVDARVQRIAETRGVSPAEVYASLEKAKRLGELERSLTEDKVFELLLSQSTVQEGS